MPKVKAHKGQKEGLIFRLFGQFFEQLKLTVQIAEKTVFKANKIGNSNGVSIRKSLIYFLYLLPIFKKFFNLKSGNIAIILTFFRFTVKLYVIYPILSQRGENIERENKNAVTF